MNVTFAVPAGSSQHGNPHLLCTPPKWHEFVVFYFANYFAHALTIIITPDQTPFEVGLTAFFALMFPVSGVGRAVRAIRRRSRLERDVLKGAARAGAVCMVVRVPAVDVGGEKRLRLSDVFRQAEEAGGALALRRRHWWDPARKLPELSPTTIHGNHKLPPGFQLALVPPSAPLALSALDGPNHVPELNLTSSSNVPKLLISLVQALWGGVTLYRARGDQIERYGYAAFGLTVAPYVFMSLMNAIGGLLNYNFPAVFMIRTPLMDEAETQGGMFNGEIRVEIDREGPATGELPFEAHQFLDYIIDYVFTFWLGFIPLAIVGGLSGFRGQDSTCLQKVFVLGWLIAGIAVGAGIPVIFKDVLRFNFSMRSKRVAILVYSVWPLGGMVVVGSMLVEFGTCLLIG